MRSKYYKILGIPEGASEKEIKKAYKKMALKYHPDINSSDSAHADFLKIKEAYEILTGKKAAYTAVKKKPTPNQYRKRPPVYARKQQAEKESEGVKHFNNILDLGYLILTIVFLLFIPIFGYFAFGFVGLLTCLSFILLSAKVILSAFKNIKITNFNKLFESLEYLVGNTKFKIGMFSIVNMVLFFSITLQHLVSLYILVGISFGLPFLGWMLFRFFKAERWKSILIGAVYLGLAVQFFFAINYLGDTKKYSEVYRFYNEEGRQWNPSNDTFIHLEGGAYDEYPWLRFVPNYRLLFLNSEAVYVFSDGLFGIKVLKDYTFRRSS